MRRNFNRPFQVPADATEVVLVRHGSTARAAPGESFDLVGGHTDAPLSSRGQQQARAVGARLANERATAVFVTSLQRTAQTAAPLTEMLGIEPVVVDELREVHLGDAETVGLGRLFRDDAALAARLFEEQRWDLIPNAESMEVFSGRVAEGLASVVGRTGAGGMAVAFVHGAVIAEICRQVTGSAPLAFLQSDNGSITRVVRLSDGSWVLRSFNDTSHIDAPQLTSISAVREDTSTARHILAIQALLGRYAWLVDRGDWDEWARCFTRDGSFVVRGSPVVGRDAIVAYVKDELARFRLIRHLGHAPEITLGEDGTSAQCRSYFELRAITRRGTDTEALGSYVDSLRLTDEGWQFAERRAEFDYWTRRGEPWSGSAENR